MKVRGGAAAVMLVAALWSAVPAAAVVSADPDDTPGKLDVEELRVTQDVDARLRIVIRTFEPWGTHLLRRPGPNWIRVLFDTEPGGGPEYSGRIYELGGRLTIQINGQGSQFENLPVRHPNGRTARLVVPGDTPMSPLGVGVAVRTRVFKEGSVCDPACRDRAPDGGFLAEVV